MSPEFPTDLELDTIFQRMVSPAAMDTKDGYNQADSEILTPPYTPITPVPPPLCLSSPSTSSESGQSTSLGYIPQPSNDAAESDTVVSLSTSFHPAAGHCGGLPPDLVLLSADSVFFYVHSSVICSASNNNLCGFLTSADSKRPQDGGVELVMLPDQSQVLNIILHFIYNISPAHHSPPFHILSQAVDRLHTAYGVDVNHGMQRSASPAPKNTQYTNEASLFALLVAHAPLHPIEVYALAASIDLYPLAQTASLYLHGLDISPSDDGDDTGGKLRLTAEMAQKMGGVYLLRLAGMHKQRLAALRTTVCAAPEGHLLDRPSEDACSAEDQASLKRAWALTAAYIICTAGPGISAKAVEGTFRPLAQHVTCSRCRQALDARLESINREWELTPRTI